MRRRRLFCALALGALALLGACGAGGEAAGDGGPAEASAPADGAPPADAPVAPICDGSTGIRFAFSNISPGARLSEGRALLGENGTAFFFVVDGQCHFASNTAAGDLAIHREGTDVPLRGVGVCRNRGVVQKRNDALEVLVDPMTDPNHLGVFPPPALRCEDMQLAAQAGPLRSNRGERTTPRRCSRYCSAVAQHNTP